MMSCRSVSELLSREQFRTAPFLTKVSVRAHLAMCRHCTRFARQLGQMRALVRLSVSRQDADPDLEKRVLEKLQ